MNEFERIDSKVIEYNKSVSELHDTVIGLLTRLERVPDGATVTVRGYTLTRVTGQTKVGSYDGWWLDSAAADCWLDRPFGEEGYWHGDFNHPWRGPDVTDLLAFADRAEVFVGELLRFVESRADKLQSAIATVKGSR